MIRHISLDYWNTIARANPDYTKARTRYLSSMFSCTLEEAKAVYTRVKTRLDDEAANEGRSTPRDDNLTALARELGKPDFERSAGFIGNALDQMFLSSPPIISPEMRKAVIRAHEYGLTVSIASNTNFIRGETLRQTMPDWPFAFTLFSDEAETSKPHADFFARVVGLTMHANSRFTERSQIAHIGDNQICDGNASKFGLTFLGVANPDETVTIINRMLDGML